MTTFYYKVVYNICKTLSDKTFLIRPIIWFTLIFVSRNHLKSKKINLKS